MFNRRRFLEDSILATTAALAGSSVTRGATQQDATSASSNERLAIAVIGTGGRGSIFYLDQYYDN